MYLMPSDAFVAPLPEIKEEAPEALLPTTQGEQPAARQ